ncbi:hypothetical protein FRC00_004412, partial [Tulasnella sp. 408]
PLSPPEFENGNAEADEGGEAQMAQEKAEAVNAPPTQPPNPDWINNAQYQQDPSTTNQQQYGLSQVDPQQLAFASPEQIPPDQPAAIHRSDSDQDTSMESVAVPDPNGKGKGKALSPHRTPAASLRGTNTSSPPEMEWGPDVVFPTSDPTSSTQSRPNPRSEEGMDVDPKTLDASLAGAASSSTVSRPASAGATGLNTTLGRQIKRVRLITRHPQPTSTPQDDTPQTDVPMEIDEDSTSAPIHRSSPPGLPTPSRPSTISHDSQQTYAKAGEICPSPMIVDPNAETPVVDSQQEDAAEDSEESLSEQDSPIPNEGEGQVVPSEQPANEVDELDSDDEPLDLLRRSSPADHGESQANNAEYHAARVDDEAESSDNESDFSDAIHEAKASKYSTSNASAAAEIEQEFEDTPDPEIQPQAPVEPRTGPRLSTNTAAFGLPESVGPRAGRSTSPTARLASISSALGSFSISGLNNAGGSSVSSPAGGEPAADEDEEDGSPLL